jgi:feruloyl-CoA synthase
MKPEEVKAGLMEGLKKLKQEGGSSTYPARLLIMSEPPSIDANEITDKGYMNQRAVLERRGALVENLYSADPAVISA